MAATQHMRFADAAPTMCIPFVHTTVITMEWSGAYSLCPSAICYLLYLPSASHVSVRFAGNSPFACFSPFISTYLGANTLSPQSDDVSSQHMALTKM